VYDIPSRENSIHPCPIMSAVPLPHATEVPTLPTPDVVVGKVTGVTGNELLLAATAKEVVVLPVESPSCTLKV
jgi:hypothetical protein